MLCEQCQERDATVHLTIIEHVDGVCDRNYCESCYPGVQDERDKANNPKLNNPLPTNIADIAASEYLEASERAKRNGADKPVFKHIREELRRLPKSRERLALEMQLLVWQSLERETEPRGGADVFACGFLPKNAKQLHQFVQWLEKVIARCFELRSQRPSSPSEPGAFLMPLFIALMTLGRADRARFSAMVEALRQRGGNSSLDPRWKVIDRAEKMILRSAKGGV